MTPEEFRTAYPLLISWIKETNRRYANQARAVDSLDFTRLSGYFPADMLAATKVMYLDDLPFPPLASMGLSEFAHFHRGDPDGIAYLDTIYIQDEQSADAPLVFHELIHVLQWRLLGPERFLALYAEGLERFGYRESPLEDMAYRAEARFADSDTPFDAEAFVRGELRGLVDGVRSQSSKNQSSKAGL